MSLLSVPVFGLLVFGLLVFGLLVFVFSAPSGYKASTIARLAFSMNTPEVTLAVIAAPVPTTKPEINAPGPVQIPPSVPINSPIINATTATPNFATFSTRIFATSPLNCSRVSLSFGRALIASHASLISNTATTGIASVLATPLTQSITPSSNC